MAQFIPDERAFASLEGKNVVLTGAATGIGAATATLLVHAGANVFFGDVATQPAEELVSTLSRPSLPGSIAFRHCDVTKYDDLYQLFKSARDELGQIHHAVSVAGIFEQGAWFDPALTVETVGEGPATTAVLDVNVLGSANFARIAVVFLREGISEGENRSLTLLSSVNAFRESPGLYMYQVSPELQTSARDLDLLRGLTQTDLEARDPRPNEINAQDHLRTRRHQGQLRLSGCHRHAHDHWDCREVQEGWAVCPVGGIGRAHHSWNSGCRGLEWQGFLHRGWRWLGIRG
jgi:NADP-dependent 3-hydroxy acid dehydrogenase YdfG